MVYKRKKIRWSSDFFFDNTLCQKKNEIIYFDARGKTVSQEFYMQKNKPSSIKVIINTGELRECCSHELFLFGISLNMGPCPRREPSLVGFSRTHQRRSFRWPKWLERDYHKDWWIALNVVTCRTKSSGCWMWWLCDLENIEYIIFKWRKNSFLKNCFL